MLRNILLALLLTYAVSSALAWIGPAEWLQNLIVNFFVLVPALLAAVLAALGKASGQIKTWILGFFVTVLALPLAGATFGGLAGMASPELYGVDGILAVRNCAPERGCDGFFSSETGLSGIVPIANRDAEVYRLHPGSSVRARVYATKPYPGRQDWRGLEIQPRSQTISIRRAFLVAVASFALWVAFALPIFIYRIRHRSFEALWASATAPFRGQIFGTACTFLGLAITVSAIIAFTYCIVIDLSRPPGDPPFHVAALGSDAWLTVTGLGLAILMWGIAENRPSPTVGKLSGPVLTVGIFYFLFTGMSATYLAVGPAITRLIPPDLLSEWVETFQRMERFADVFNPSLIVANLAVAVSLLASAMQASIFVGLQNIRTRASPPVGIRVMRERGAPELLYILATKSAATAEELRDQIPFRPSVRIVKRTLRRLEGAGAVFLRIVEGDDATKYELTNRGHALAVALNELL